MTFAGSRDVGGADADLLVGRLLVEVKATSRPDLLSNLVIWQLAGYLLLDYDDRYQIDSVAFYMSRAGYLATWDVAQFLELLGARHALPRLRDRFASVLAASPER